MLRFDLSCLSPEEKDALILALLDRVAVLEAKLSGPPKTPGNSSVPPSRGRKANRPPRPKTPRRKRDGPGVTRALAGAADHVVACHVQACAHCGMSVTAESQTLRHAYDHIDLPPFRPVVTRVQLFGRRCPGCRRRMRGTPPETMPPGSPFGPSIMTMLAYLHHHHAVGYERLSKLMAELFGLSISEGAIANALRRARRPLESSGAAIAEQLRRAAVIGCDETGARVTTETLGARMAWEWVLVSDTAVLHRIHPSRGRDVIADVLGAHWPRCWVSDRWSAQQGHAQDHQVCLAHRPLRDAQYAGERGFAPALRRLLCWAIAIGRRRASLKDSTLAQYRAKAERRLDRLLAMPAVTPAGAELQRQTKRWRSQFFTFMTARDVPPTNNAAERALRPSVIFRKVTNGFRSIWGGDVHALIRSVIGTGRLHGLAAHQAISRALAGQSIFAT